MLEGGLQAAQADGDVVGTSRVRDLDTLDTATALGLK
jgi:hypothetical protein